MRLKYLLLTILLLIPILSFGETIKKSDLTQSGSLNSDSMDISSLIEKAKSASDEERIEIEKLIKKKIAQSHRDKNS